MSVQDVIDDYVRDEVAVKLWLEAMAGTKLPPAYWEELKDGTLLCTIMLDLVPGSIPHIERDASAFFHIKNNIRFFLEACEEEFELKRNVLFDVYDLYQLRSIPRVVCCIKELARSARERNPDIPKLRKDLSQEELDENKSVTPERARTLASNLLSGAQLRSRFIAPRRRVSTQRAGEFKKIGVEVSTGSGKRSSGLQWVTRSGPVVNESVCVADDEDEAPPGVGSGGVFTVSLAASPRTLEGKIPEDAGDVAGIEGDKCLAEGDQAGSDATGAGDRAAESNDIPGECAEQQEEEEIAPFVYPFPIDQESGFTDLSEHPEVVEFVGKAISRMQAVVRGNMARRAFRKRVRNEAYRAKVAREILGTETDYIQNLRLLTHAYLIPIGELNCGEQWESQMKLISSETKVILGYGMQLLKDIKPRVADWNHRQRLGDVFLRLTDYMKVYTQYVRDFSPLMDVIVAEKKSKSSTLRIKLEELEEQDEVKSRGLPFESYLILPVQRIPRYQLLLNDMFTHTDPQHPDFENLQKAKEKMTEVGAYVNERQRHFESLSAVLEVNHKFGGLDNLVQSHRKLVREGEMCKYPRGRRQRWFLFNDILLIGAPLDKKDKRFKLREQIPLRNVAVAGISTPDPDVHALKLRHRETGEVLVEALAKSAAEKASWMREINTVLVELMQCSAQLAVEVVETSAPAVAEKKQRRLSMANLLVALEQNESTPSPGRLKSTLLGGLRSSSGNSEELLNTGGSHPSLSVTEDAPEDSVLGNRKRTDDSAASLAPKKTRHRRSRSFDAFFGKSLDRSEGSDDALATPKEEKKAKKKKGSEHRTHARKGSEPKVLREKEKKATRRLTIGALVGSVVDRNLQKKLRAQRSRAVEESLEKKLSTGPEGPPLIRQSSQEFTLHQHRDNDLKPSQLRQESSEDLSACDSASRSGSGSMIRFADDDDH